MLIWPTGSINARDEAVPSAFAGAFIARRYNVIVWDAAPTFNRSESDTKKASFYNYHQDLEDLI